MNKLKKWFFPFAAFLFLLVGGVSTGYSLFYINSTEQTAEVPAKVDNIEENYALADAGQESNYYTLYFFAQPMAEASVVDIDNSSYTPDNAAGYWAAPVSNDTSLTIVSQSSSNTYGWRKVVVYRSLSTDVLTAIGKVETNKTTHYQPGDPDYIDTHIPYSFSGWTNNRDKARQVFGGIDEAGDIGLGGFDLIDTTQSLGQIDNEGIDGTTSGDHVIFLYPVLSPNKDMKDPTSGNKPVIELVGKNDYSGTNYILSRLDPNQATGEKYEYGDYNLENASYYQEYLLMDFNNLVIDNGGSFDLIAHFTNNDSWYTDKSNSTADTDVKLGTLGTSSNTDGDNNSEPLVSLSGIYNVHVYVLNYRWQYEYSRNGEATEIPSDVSENFEAYVNRNTPSNRIITKRTTGTSKIIYSWDHWEGLPWISDHFWRTVGFYYFVEIERVYEFKLLGGPFGTFNYNSNMTRIFYSGEIYNDEYSSNSNDDYGDTFTKTYGLNNVFIDASGDTFGDDYIGNPSNTDDDYDAKGTFNSNVFTIDAQNLIKDGDGYFIPTIESFTDNELSNIDHETGQDYYTLGRKANNNDDNTVTVTDSDLVQKAKSSTESSDDFDYELTISGQPAKAHRTLLKITKTGYYNFRIQVTFNKSGDVGNTGSGEINGNNLNNYVSSIKVAVAPVISEYFVKIFVNNDFETQDGFIVHDNADGDYDGSSHNGNKLLYTFNFTESGTELTGDSVFESPTGEKIPFSDLLVTYPNLFDQLTGAKVYPGMILERNYVFCTASV